MNIAQALEQAPPTPACFPDRLQWAAYLLSAQENKRPVKRPFDDKGRFQPGFSFCADCTPAHADNMTARGKCNPGIFKSLPVKVIACN